MSDKHRIKELIVVWRYEFDSIKEQLITKGSEANSQEYNLLATEALRLSLCINDLTDLLLVIEENKNQLAGVTA